MLLGGLLFAAATALGVALPVPAVVGRWLALTALAAHGLLLARRGAPQRAAPRRRLSSCALLLAVGLARGAHTERAGPTIASSGAPRTERSVVVECARVNDVAIVRRVRRRGAAGDHGELRPRTTFRTAQPTLRVVVEGDVSFLRPGDRVRLTGCLPGFRPLRNPGEPGRERAGLPPLLWVPHDGLVRRLTGAGVPPVRCPGPCARALLWLRDRAVRLVDRLHDDPARGVVLALLLGRREALDPGLRASLRASGTYHFVAISGLHVGLLLAALGRLPLPAAGRIGALTLFALVSGGAPPVLRALLMVALPVVAAACGRGVRSLDAFGATIVILLALQPHWIREPGFQLSASAVFSILVWTRPIESWLAREIPRLVLFWRPPGRIARSPRRWMLLATRFVALWCLRPLAVSLAAFLGTAPALLYHFGGVHPLGVVWSVLLYPLVTLLLLVSGAALLLGSVHPVLGEPAAALCGGLVHCLVRFVPLLAGVPASSIHAGPGATWVAIPAAVLSTAGTLLATASGWRRPARLVALAGLAVLLVGLVPWHRGAPAPGPVEVWVFDVGDGSSVLVRSTVGECVLVDAGSSSHSWRLGERLARWLVQLGVRRLDDLVLTHADADHVNGVLDLLEVLPARRVWISPFFEEGAGGKAFLAEIARRGWRVGRLARGQRIVGRTGWRLDVLHPWAGEQLPLRTRSNEASIVLRLVAGRHAALLPADIEEHGTARLLSGNEPLEAGLLVVPHHGRHNRLLGPLLDRVRPGHAILSAEKESVASSVRRELESRGIDRAATWRDGALLARPGPDTTWIVEGLRQVTCSPNVPRDGAW